MIDVHKLPPGVLYDLTDWVKANRKQHAEKPEEYIRLMTPTEAFGMYLEWNGIVGYATRIQQALDGIREADLSGMSFSENIVDICISEQCTLQIREDGRVLWLNDPQRCLLRVCTHPEATGISFKVDDQRPEGPQALCRQIIDDNAGGKRVTEVYTERAAIALRIDGVEPY
jgi:hypothetical protein